MLIKVFGNSASLAKLTRLATLATLAALDDDLRLGRFTCPLHLVDCSVGKRPLRASEFLLAVLALLGACQHRFLFELFRLVVEHFFVGPHIFALFHLAMP